MNTFCSDIAENEECKEPSQWVLQCFSRTSRFSILATWIFNLVNGSGLFPKCTCRSEQFNSSTCDLYSSVFSDEFCGMWTYHEKVEIVPFKPAFGKHQCSNQWRNCSTYRIATMQCSSNLVCICHICKPSTPRRIHESISETNEDEDDHEDGVRRMESKHDKGEEMTEWCDDRYTTLTEIDVNIIVCNSGKRIARERGEENQRDNSVS